MPSASLPIELDSAAALRRGAAGCTMRVWVLALVVTAVSLRAVSGAMKRPGWIASWVGRRMGERDAEKAQGLRMGRWELIISKLSHDKSCHG